MKKGIMFLILILSSTIYSSANEVTVDKLINDYLALKNSLFKDNGDSARSNAKIFFRDLQDFKPDNLSGNAKKAYNQFVEKISYDIEHIKETTEIEHQREHFVTLSSNMYKLLQGLSKSSIKLYHQYCPMANDGKGAYWLNESEEIINPYMGSKMPKCGSVKDSLNVK